MSLRLLARVLAAGRVVLGLTLLATPPRVAAALGGHGELVEKPEDMAGAIERSLASGKPACINVMIESIPSPVVRFTAP